MASSAADARGYDPTEWARQRQRQVNKAAQLREERKLGCGSVPEDLTFRPKLITKHAQAAATSRLALGITAPPRRGTYNLDGSADAMRGAYPTHARQVSPQREGDSLDAFARSAGCSPAGLRHRGSANAAGGHGSAPRSPVRSPGKVRNGESARGLEQAHESAQQQHDSRRGNYDHQWPAQSSSNSGHSRRASNNSAASPGAPAASAHARQRLRPSWNNDFSDAGTLSHSAAAGGAAPSGADRRHSSSSGTDAAAGRRAEGGRRASRNTAPPPQPFWGDGHFELPAGGGAAGGRIRGAPAPEDDDIGGAAPQQRLGRGATVAGASGGRAHTCVAGGEQEWEGYGSWEGAGVGAAALLGEHSGGYGSYAGGEYSCSRPELSLLKQKISSRKGSRRASDIGRSRSATLPARGAVDQGHFADPSAASTMYATPSRGAAHRAPASQPAPDTYTADAPFRRGNTSGQQQHQQDSAAHPLRARRSGALEQGGTSGVGASGSSSGYRLGNSDERSGSSARRGGGGGGGGEDRSYGDGARGGSRGGGRDSWLAAEGSRNGNADRAPSRGSASISRGSAAQQQSAQQCQQQQPSLVGRVLGLAGLGSAADGGGGGGGGGPDEEYADVELHECPDCGRKFSETALAKHAGVCKKVFQQKRRAFDTAKMRVAGTEMAAFAGKGHKGGATRRGNGGGGNGANGASSGGGGAIKPASGASKWRSQSNAFREAIRTARMVSHAQAKGIPLSELPMPAAPSAPDPSLVPCPHCGRRFNESAAERHIPRCTSIRAQPTRLVKGSGKGLGATSRAAQQQGRRAVMGR